MNSNDLTLKLTTFDTSVSTPVVGSSLSSGYYNCSQIAYGGAFYSLSNVLNFLSEDEISTIANKMHERMTDTDFKLFIENVISSVKLSEEFLLEYISYVDRNALYVNHKREIVSGEYTSIKTYLDLNN